METMPKLTIAQKQILNALSSDDDKVVVKTINDIRNKGGIYVVEPLMSLYFESGKEIISNEVVKLFSDLKDNSLANTIAENILKYKKNEKLSVFVSALWQSSLKFDNLKIFFEIFITESDNTSFEVLTLIQQNAYNMTENMKTDCLKMLKSDISNLSDFKKTLAVDLLEILE
jgi:hypothetical protein